VNHRALSGVSNASQLRLIDDGNRRRRASKFVEFFRRRSILTVNGEKRDSCWRQRRCWRYGRRVVVDGPRSCMGRRRANMTHRFELRPVTTGHATRSDAYWSSSSLRSTICVRFDLLFAVDAWPSHVHQTETTLEMACRQQHDSRRRRFVHVHFAASLWHNWIIVRKHSQDSFIV